MVKKTQKVESAGQFIMVEGLTKSRSAIVMIQRPNFGTSQIKTHAIADPMPDIYPVAAIQATQQITKFFNRQLRHPKYAEVRKIIETTSTIATLMANPITKMTRDENSGNPKYTFTMVTPTGASTAPTATLTIEEAENRLEEISVALKDKEALYWQHEEVFLFPDTFDPSSAGEIKTTVGYEKSINIECLNPGIAKLLNAGLLYALPIILEESKLYEKVKDADSTHTTIWFETTDLKALVDKYVASSDRNDQITHVMNVAEVLEAANWTSYIVTPLLRDMFVHTVPYLPTLASKILAANGSTTGFTLLEAVAEKRAARKYSIQPLEEFSGFLQKVTPRTSIAFGTNIVNIPYGADKLMLGSSAVCAPLEVVGGYFVTRGTVAVYPLRLKKSADGYKSQTVKIINEDSFDFGFADLNILGGSSGNTPKPIDPKSQERFRVPFKLKGNDVVIRPQVTVHKTEAHSQSTERMIIVSGDIDSKRLVFVDDTHFDEMWRDEDVTIDLTVSLAV